MSFSCNPVELSDKNRTKTHARESVQIFVEIEKSRFELVMYWLLQNPHEAFFVLRFRGLKKGLYCERMSGLPGCHVGNQANIAFEVRQ